MNKGSDKMDIRIPLAVGLDEAKDPKAVMGTGNLVVENAIFDKEGSISKRTGFSEYDTLAIDPDCLFDFGDTVYALSNTQLYNTNSDSYLYNGTSTTDQFHVTEITTEPFVGKISEAFHYPYSFETSTHKLCVYSTTAADNGTDTYSTRLSVYSDNEKRITSDVEIQSISNFMPQARIFQDSADTIWVIYPVLITGDVYLRIQSLNGSYALTGTTQNISGGGISVLLGIFYTAGETQGYVFDSMYVDDRLYITYTDGGGTPIAELVSWNTVAGTGARAAVGSDVERAFLFEPISRTGIGICYVDTAVSITVYDNALSSQYAGDIATAWDMGAVGGYVAGETTCWNLGSTNNGTYYFFYFTLQNIAYTGSVESSPTIERIVWSPNGAGVTIENHSSINKQAHLACQPYLYGGNVYIVCLYKGVAGIDRYWFSATMTNKGSLDRLYYVLKDDLTTAPGDFLPIIGKIMDDEAGGWQYGQEDVAPTSPSMPDIYQIGITGEFRFIAQRLGEFSSEPLEESAVLLDMVTVDLSPDRVRARVIGDLVTLEGSLPQMFDGERITESGFIMGPAEISVSSSTGGASAVLEGTYSYIAVYEWTSKKGHKYRSYPSQLATVIHPSSGPWSNFLLVQTCHVTNRPRTEINIVIYRTLVNGPVSESSMYKVGEVKNSATEDFISFTDILPDSAIRTRATIYSAGDAVSSGVLGYRAPYGYEVDHVHKDRHFYVRKDRADKEIYLSSPFHYRNADQQLNREPVTYSPYLTIAITPTGGDVTAMASLNEKLIIFKKNYIFYTHGQGPNRAGQGNYSEPYIISNSIGCVNKDSVVETPVGVMFEAAAGIYMIDQSHQVTFVGKKVEYSVKNQTIKEALLLPARNIVAFIGDTSTIVYDYFYGQWSTWTGLAATSAVVRLSSNELHLAIDGGSIWKENSAVYQDNLVNYAIKVATGWVSANQVAGYKRVRKTMLIGQNISEHKLQIKIAYDYDPMWTDTLTFDTDANLGLGFSGYDSHYAMDINSAYDGHAMMVEFGGSRQKCASIKFEFTDILADGETDLGASFSLNGLILTVAVDIGTYRVGSSRRSS